jgi:hypothetical protein
MLTKTDLDRLTAGGCQHRDHVAGEPCGAGGRMYLRCQRHKEGQFFVRLDQALVRAYCIVRGCDMDETFPGTFYQLVPMDWQPLGIVCQFCHPRSACWISYLHGSGVIELTCYECGQKIGEIVLN